jgi:hypothetical protein
MNLITVEVKFKGIKVSGDPHYQVKEHLVQQINHGTLPSEVADIFAKAFSLGNCNEHNIRLIHALIEEYLKYLHELRELTKGQVKEQL